MAAAPRSRIMIATLVLLVASFSASAIYIFTAQAEAATIHVRCPGGEVDLEGVSLQDGAELKVPARATSFELRPAGKPPQVIEFNLQPKQVVVIDCAVE